MSPTTTQPDPPYIDGDGMIQVPGLTIDRIHENFEGIEQEPNPGGLLDHLLGIDPTPVSPSGTSPLAWVLAGLATLTVIGLSIAATFWLTRRATSAEGFTFAPADPAIDDLPAPPESGR